MLVLLRDAFTETAILGRLFLGGTCICSTLENRSKAIPCGTYNIANSKSPKFKRELPLIYGYKVAESRGIRIHAGNSSKDSAGCVLVGMGRDTVEGSLSESRLAETMVTMLCRNIRHLTITELG
jgi:hypothetical protein